MEPAEPGTGAAAVWTLIGIREDHVRHGGLPGVSHRQMVSRSDQFVVFEV